MSVRSGSCPHLGHGVAGDGPRVEGKCGKWRAVRRDGPVRRRPPHLRRRLMVPGRTRSLGPALNLRPGRQTARQSPARRTRQGRTRSEQRVQQAHILQIRRARIGQPIGETFLHSGSLQNQQGSPRVIPRQGEGVRRWVLRPFRTPRGRDPDDVPSRHSPHNGSAHHRAERSQTIPRTRHATARDLSVRHPHVPQAVLRRIPQPVHTDQVLSRTHLHTHPADAVRRHGQPQCVTIPSSSRRRSRQRAAKQQCDPYPNGYGQCPPMCHAGKTVSAKSILLATRGNTLASSRST